MGFDVYLYTVAGECAVKGVRVESHLTWQCIKSSILQHKVKEHEYKKT
jgi:hypothetical protein